MANTLFETTLIMKRQCPTCKLVIQVLLYFYGIILITYSQEENEEATLGWILHAITGPETASVSLTDIISAKQIGQEFREMI